LDKCLNNEGNKGFEGVLPEGVLLERGSFTVLGVLAGVFAFLENKCLEGVCGSATEAGISSRGLCCFFFGFRFDSKN
jgi:hypothetical protein